MATPITFSVGAASRQGVFQTAALTMPSGYTLLQWTLTIPNTTEYENTANSFTTEIFYDPAGGTNFQTAGGKAVWTGGRAVDKSGNVDFAPAMSLGVGNIPVGSSVVVRITIPNAMTIGISNGSLS